MGKPAHILALLGLLSMGRGEPSLVITETVGGTTKPVASRVTLRAGMYVQLACKVVDRDKEKANQVTWSKRTYYSSRFQPKKMLKPYKDSIVATPEPSKLQFLPVTLQDRGTYICLDAAHNQSKLVFVTVQSRNDRDNKLKRDVYDGLYTYTLSTSESSIFNISPVTNSHVRDNEQSYQLKPEVNISNYESILGDLLKKYNLEKYKDDIKFSDTNESSKFHFDLPKINFTLPEFKYDDLVDIYNRENSKKSNSNFYYYTVSVPIAIVLIICRIYVYAHNAAQDDAQSSNDDSTRNPDSGTNELPPVHNSAMQNDAQPSYDDSTRNPNSGSNVLPPSYDEAMAILSSNAAANLHEATDSASVAAPDVLSMPHSGNIQQRV